MFFLVLVTLDWIQMQLGKLNKNLSYNIKKYVPGRFLLVPILKCSAFLLTWLSRLHLHARWPGHVTREIPIYIYSESYLNHEKIWVLVEFWYLVGIIERVKYSPQVDPEYSHLCILLICVPKSAKPSHLYFLYRLI